MSGSVALVSSDSNKSLKGSHLQIVVGQELWAWWGGRELVLLIDGWAGLASNNLSRLVGEVGDHIFSNWTVEELIHGVILILWTAWVGLVVHLGGWLRVFSIVGGGRFSRLIRSAS